MSIYHSTKILPYVYLGTHRITGQYYIGYRAANTVPSDQDIFRYKTSSNTVKPQFNEFEWIIVAEFFDADSAYAHEQLLLHEVWGDPLLLNKWVGPLGGKRGQITDETRRKISESQTGKVTSDETKHLISQTKTGVPDRIVTCPHCGKTGGIKNMNRYHFDNCTTSRQESRLDRLALEKFRTETGKLKRYPKIRVSVKDPVLTCPHCAKSGGQRNMTRYHFDNCRSRPTSGN